MKLITLKYIHDSQDPFVCKYTYLLLDSLHAPCSLYGVSNQHLLNILVSAVTGNEYCYGLTNSEKNGAKQISVIISSGFVPSSNAVEVGLAFHPLKL